MAKTNDLIDQQITINVAKDMAALFAGRQSAYGQFVLTPGANEAKVKGKCSTINAPITDDLFLKHLKGIIGLGVVPIKENNTCSFAVIDMDIYTEAIQSRVMAVIEHLSAPLVPFKSKSGGLHICCFFTDEIKASKVIEYMNKFKALLGLDKDTEIFPKQAKTSATDIGNWINLPLYHAGPHCKRNMLLPDMTQLSSAAQVLSKCMAMRITEGGLESYFTSLPLVDAPPCLQRIYLMKKTTNRNLYLFALGRYYKAKYGDQFDEYLLEANRMLENPLEISEVIQTVVVSLKKKDYKSYTCGQEPLSTYCDKKECSKRKYGIGGKEVSNLSYGEFRQILTDPPTYEWVVNDKVLQFDSAASIINQVTFREQCVDKLHLMPNKLNDPAWSDIINTALTGVIEISVNPDDDISPGAMLVGYVIDYIKKRRLAQNRLGIFRGLVYKDQTEGVSAYIFDIKLMVNQLIMSHDLKVYNLNELKSKLVKLGGKAVKYYINAENPACALWCLPIAAVDNMTKTISADSDEDFIAGLQRDFGDN